MSAETLTAPAPEASSDAPTDPRQEKLDAAAKVATEVLRLAGLIPEAKSAPGRKAQVQSVGMLLSLACQQLSK